MSKFALDLQQHCDWWIVKAPTLVTKFAENPSLEALDFTKGLAESCRFLSLIGHYQQKLTPSLCIDLIWHEMILHTKAYSEYGQHFYGRYIHHHPGGLKEENQRQYEQTLCLYHANFGIPPSEFWPNSETLIANCGNCSS